MSRLAPDSARPARGFSLVEVLVALGLSLMVSMAALEHLRVAREASRAVSGRTDVQHQAALALDLIRSEIRRAGFRVDAHTSLEDAFAQQSFSLGEPAQSTTVPGRTSAPPQSFGFGSRPAATAGTATAWGRRLLRPVRSSWSDCGSMPRACTAASGATRATSRLCCSRRWRRGR
jgi:prepilin-type N-terminal cleavage/methylation domain-containing protein